MTRVTLFWLGCVCVMVGCGGSDTVADGDSGAAGADDGGGLLTGSDGAALADGRAAFCVGRGPAVAVPGADGASSCTGAIAERVFRHAVCSCDDTMVTSRLTTDSFASGPGSMTTDSGGPVGVNDEFSVIGGFDVGGSLTVAGSAGVDFVTSGSRVGGDLRSAAVMFTGSAIVERDMHVVGEISGIGSLMVRRDLHQTLGAASSSFVRVEGATIREPVSVVPPCDCNASRLLDIGAIVAAVRTDNHNSEIPLAHDAFLNLLAETHVELPCGRFYLDGIGGVGALTLVVNGRTALFVGGDVSLTGTLNVVLGPEGELDLFIAGNLTGIGTLRFGDPTRPAATRVYVGGSGELRFAGGSTFVGNVYAPRAPIGMAGSMDVYGSLFGRSVTSVGTLNVHYDRSILEVGDECPPPPLPPSDCACGDCSDGYECESADMCLTGCASDADCCEPFTCEAGACTFILI